MPNEGDYHQRWQWRRQCQWPWCRQQRRWQRRQRTSSIVLCEAPTDLRLSRVVLVAGLAFATPKARTAAATAPANV